LLLSFYDANNLSFLLVCHRMPHCGSRGWGDVRHVPSADGSIASKNFLTEAVHLLDLLFVTSQKPSISLATVPRTVSPSSGD